LKSKQESKKEIYVTKILEGCQIQGKKEKQKFNTVVKATVLVSSDKKNNKALPKRLASKPPFSSQKEQRIKLLSLHRSLVLLCSLQGKIVLDQRFKPFSVKLKHSHSCTIKRVPALLQTAVSFYNPYSVNEMSSILLCLCPGVLVAEMKLQEINLQVYSSNSKDKFQICFTDMYLVHVEFLANFAVFHVFLSISQDFADIREFRSSTTTQNFRSPE